MSDEPYPRTRAKLPVVAHVFLLREGRVLLARRAGTGFEDGSFGPVGGHLDGGEPATAAAARECVEEIGVELEPDDLTFAGITHYGSPPGEGIDLFFTATRWVGEPRPLADCNELRWCRPDDLPDPTPRFVRRAVEHHLLAGQRFDELGWESSANRLSRPPD